MTQQHAAKNERVRILLEEKVILLAKLRGHKPFTFSLFERKSKSRCKNCGGWVLCEHKRQKIKLTDCSTCSRICLLGRDKHTCKFCPCTRRCKKHLTFLRAKGKECKSCKHNVHELKWSS